MPRICVLSLLGLIAPALLGASAPTDDEERARYRRAIERGTAQASFARAAHAWYAAASERADAARETPRLRADAAGRVTATYRLVAPGYETEVRATGVEEAPFVGVLRFREWVYRCRDARADECSVSHDAPRVALFRFRGGRWDY